MSSGATATLFYGLASEGDDGDADYDIAEKLKESHSLTLQTYSSDAAPGLILAVTASVQEQDWEGSLIVNTENIKNTPKEMWDAWLQRGLLALKELDRDAWRALRKSKSAWRLVVMRDE